MAATASLRTQYLSGLPGFRTRGVVTNQLLEYLPCLRLLVGERIGFAEMKPPLVLLRAVRKLLEAPLKRFRGEPSVAYFEIVQSNPVENGRALFRIRSRFALLQRPGVVLAAAPEEPRSAQALAHRFESLEVILVPRQYGVQAIELSHVSG